MIAFQAWLENPSAVRGILVLAHVSAYNTGSAIWEDKVIYLSNIGYITQDSTTSFLPIIVGGASFNESISLDSSISMSFGDIEIANHNGDYDDWLDNSKYIWVNKPIQIYYGDPLVPSTNLTDIQNNTFEKIFDGIISDVDTKSRISLNIKVRDKLERLNTPLTENKLGTYGTWGQGQTNQDSTRPLILGEVHNITPLLVDPSLLKYMINDGSTERLIEVRDNGVPITVGNTVLANSTFELLHPAAGTITISVQGIKSSIDLSTGLTSPTYSNSIAKLIALITTQYGNSISRITTADIDLTNFLTFDTAYPQPVGTLISDRENVLVVCNSLADSIGAQMYFNRAGKLQLLRLGMYTGDPVVYITDNDLLFHSLEISSRTQVVAATKIGYCKNWTVQNNLLTNIPIAHKDMFALEWYSSTIVDSTVKTAYALNSDPIQKDTLLLQNSDAVAEATRLNNFYKIPRTVYKMTGTANLLSLKLGQEVNLTTSRFGLSVGKSGQVITLSPNWLTATIDIEVLV
jgi:hypothetical protein